MAGTRLRAASGERGTLRAIARGDRLSKGRSAARGAAESALVSEEAARGQLARILASPVFSGAERLRRFLRLSVEAGLRGPTGLLKERTIGLDVYDRGPAYDPRVDPIVRVEAARLRSKLREYYETLGAHDGVHIAVEKGSYVARLHRRRTGGRRDLTPGAGASIAVLPFADLGGGEDDYFVDGLTEELIHTLGRTAGLRVVARTSVFALKGLTLDIREIGRRLDVGAVVEGSVRRAGGRLRITARMVDAGDGCELWTEAYERDAADSLLVQKELAAAIAATLRLQLRPEAAGRTAGPAVRDLYYRGRHFYLRRTPTDARRAIDLFNRALAAQADHAPSLAGIANAHGLLAYWEIDRTENLARSVAAARQALALAPETAQAYIPLALARIQSDWDWAGAERELLAAIDLDPADSESLHLHAHLCLMPTGRIEEALSAIRLALSLDPLSPPLRASLGRALTIAGRHLEAVAALRAAIDLVPAFREAHWQLALALEQAGDYTEALRAFEQAGALEGGSPEAAGGVGHCLALAGRTAEARDLLQRPLAAGARALVHLGLGDMEAALAELEAAAAARQRLVMWLKVDPRFAPLRGRPRFDALRRAIGLT
jgi:TolB-like protein/Flp pilus assembly protein TadD